MKKLMAAFLALTLILTPAGNFLSAPHQQKADAKGYRTGVRSFHSTTRTGTNSFFKNKTIQRTERQATTRSFGNSFGGSFMRGMIFGGLSGLLFGSMFSHFGGFGMMAGFLINFLAILAIIALVRYLFVSFTGRRRAGDNDKWKR